MQERVLNFLNNWVDANILRISHEPDGDASTMQYRYLTDAVAAGLSLDEVNAEWPRPRLRSEKRLMSADCELRAKPPARSPSTSR